MMNMLIGDAWLSAMFERRRHILSESTCATDPWLGSPLRLEFCNRRGAKRLGFFPADGLHSWDGRGGCLPMPLPLPPPRITAMFHHVPCCVSSARDRTISFELQRGKERNCKGIALSMERSENKSVTQ